MKSEIPRKLWHFTSQAGFEGIIRTQRIWASSASSLDDQEEIEPGMQALRSAREEIARSGEVVHPVLDYAWAEEQLYEWLSNLFILSTTADGNSACHWQDYADQHKGVAIALDSGAQFSESVDANSISFHATSPVHDGWVKVVYSREEQDKLAKKSLIDGIQAHLRAPLGEYSGESFRRVISTAIVGSKFNLYKNEQEFRYIIGAGSTYKPQINEYTGKAYMPLAFFDPDSRCIQSLPVVEVRLGKDCDMKVEQVRRMLLTSGIVNCEVSRATL